MKHFLLIIFFIFTINIAYASTEFQPIPERITSEAEHNELMESFNNAKEAYFNKWITPEKVKESLYNLYNIQLHTMNTLIVAEKSRDYELLDELTILYDKAYESLEEVDEISFEYVEGYPKISTHQLNKTYKVWLKSNGSEHHLSTSQFLYGVARLSRILSEQLQYDLGAERRELYTNFINRWIPIIIEEHFIRWVKYKTDTGGAFSQRRGWGCSNGNFTHEEHVQNLLDRKYGTIEYGRVSTLKHCNAVTDTDLFVAGIGAETLATLEELKGNHNISGADIKIIKEHTKNLSALAEARTVITNINRDGKDISVANFDPGAFKDHPDQRYANFHETSESCQDSVYHKGDSCPEYPGSKEDLNIPRVEPTASMKGPDSIGWDLGHARRIPIIWDSLNSHKETFGGTYPSKEVINAFANQLAYVVFRGDEANPKFANFYDGTNGWYRVNFSKRLGFGFAPSGITKHIPELAFSFWGNEKLNALIKTRIELDGLGITLRKHSRLSELITINNKLYFSHSEEPNKNNTTGKNKKILRSTSTESLIVKNDSRVSIGNKESHISNELIKDSTKSNEKIGSVNTRKDKKYPVIKQFMKILYPRLEWFY